MQCIGISDIEEERDDDLSSDDENPSLDDGDSSLDDEADVPEHERKATSLVVFTMAGAKEIDGIRLAKRIDSLGENDFISRFDTHPYLPLMVCHCVSDINDEAMVVIWNFNPAVNLWH